MQTIGTATFATFLVNAKHFAPDGGHQIDWNLVDESARPGKSYTITANGGEAAAATSITVEALPLAIPAGTMLDFNGSLAKVSAYTVAGATEIPVYALADAIADDAAATYKVNTSAYKVVAAGTIMTVLESGKMIPRSMVTGSEKATGLLVSDAGEGDRFAAKSGYGLIIHAAGIYENLLPDYGAASFDTWKTELNEHASLGGWRTYGDSTGS